MDLWVVAAAAAAGYLTKHWQNFSRDRGSLSELSLVDSNFEKPESPSCPLRGLVPRKDVSTDRREVSDYHLDGDSSAEVVASTSGFDGENLGNYEDSNLLPVSTLPPGFLTNEILNEYDSVNGLSGNIGDNSGNPSTSEMDFFHGSARNRSSLRTKRLYSHFVKPLSSLESCFVAQLYNEHARMEDYVLSSLPSPSIPTMRPLLVTDGSRIINKANRNSFNVQIGTEDNELHKKSNLEKSEIVFGIPPLPKIGSLDLPKKPKLKTGKGRSGRLGSYTKVVNGKHFQSQGSHDGTVLFCLGISIGIISSFVASKREAHKLKELLKQTENLVQDLQEELEMKDSLTVKELPNENYESVDTCDNSFQDRVPNPFSAEQNIDSLTKYDGKDSCDQKAESSDCMSKIEAELEAELERMGLNMNTSNLERRFSDLVELDPDFVADFAQGELRADMVRGRAESNQDASGTSTTHSGNYAVSPRELSLRLHEVIQSRLEERVKELETALQNSENKVQLMESEHKNPWRTFSNSEQIYSFTQESPIAEACNSFAQPLVMNLSGEALDAYSEAYEELMKINDSDEEDSPLGVYETNHQVGIHPFDQSVSLGQNGGVNGSLPYLMDNKEETSEELFLSHVRLEEDSLRVQELLDVGVSGDENSDCDDEMEKQLIKQIVEKTKKGSPVVLNAQRVLFSVDENEH